VGYDFSSSLLVAAFPVCVMMNNTFDLLDILTLCVHFQILARLAGSCRLHFFRTDIFVSLSTRYGLSSTTVFVAGSVEAG
jgi:hypothetical protein